MSNLVLKSNSPWNSIRAIVKNFFQDWKESRMQKQERLSRVTYPKYYKLVDSLLSNPWIIRLVETNKDGDHRIVRMDYQNLSLSISITAKYAYLSNLYVYSRTDSANQSKAYAKTALIRELTDQNGKDIDYWFERYLDRTVEKRIAADRPELLEFPNHENHWTDRL